jgi:hypothetical protein
MGARKPRRGRDVAPLAAASGVSEKARRKPMITSFRAATQVPQPPVDGVRNSIASTVIGSMSQTESTFIRSFV